MGIISACINPKGDAVIVGCGDGTLAELNFPKLNITKTSKLVGGVTSISFMNPTTFYAGTDKCNIYRVQEKDLQATLQSTCHFTAINDIAFPLGASDVFATASDGDVRIWNAKSGAELLRIKEPNRECKTITFNKAGSSLISGWNDAKIRAYGPQSGRLQYEINDAHKGVVTALAVTDVTNNQGAFRIVSGGGDGEVRVWAVTKSTRTLEHSMKEHKGGFCGCPMACCLLASGTGGGG
jgi:WD40 repeat protein